jgi:ribosomal protein L6P/L9E
MGEVARVGKKPVPIPKGVKVELKEDGVLVVEGPKGKLEKKMPPLVKINIEDGDPKGRKGPGPVSCKECHVRVEGQK